MRPPRRILVIGGGGREHALAARFASEDGVEAVHVAPGNAGMGDVTLHPGVLAARPERVIALAREERIDLVVIGPEAPLVAGLVDALASAGITAFGPTAAAAVLEGSKSTCREVARAAGVAMADGRAFDGSDGRAPDALEAARAYARELGGDVVVKADGLAGGKGVSVCRTIGEAEAALEALLRRGALADAGRRVIVERRLDGREASLIAICDGETALGLVPARDHKRAGEGDTGPNTGGMGAYAPVPDLPPEDAQGLLEGVHLPVLREMARRGVPFRGALFAGLMLTPDGPRLLEFNVRFGDPETQVVLPLLHRRVPLAALLDAAARGRLGETATALGLSAPGVLPVRQGATVGVVVAAEGYPGAVRTGDRIEGLDEARQDAVIYAAGVQAGRDGALETAGGRVLTVVAEGPAVADAAERAHRAARAIRFPGARFRRDIGVGVGATAGAPLGVASPVTAAVGAAAAPLGGHGA